MSKIEAFQHSAYLKLFAQFKRKYYSLGRMSGAVPLDSFSPEEVEEIAGFLGVSPQKLKEKGKVSLQQFETQLQTSAFSHFTLLKLVEHVLGEVLVTRKQQQQENLQTEEIFIAELGEMLKYVPEWLEQIMQKQSDSRWIWQQQASILPSIEITANAVSNRLPKAQFERLPIFAQRTTGNPHAFDTQTLLGKLLLHAAFSLSNEVNEFPKSTQGRNDLLAELGIVQDDLWSFVTAQGLLAFRNGQPHTVWQAAVEERSVMNIPMRELIKIEKILPADGQRIWIVENSSVASTLMDANPSAPIVCTHGQLRMAGWRLLDLFDEHIQFYYSGDLDPEGILIAQRLVQRYGKRVHLWHMDEYSYEIGRAELISPLSLTKLQHVTILPSVIDKMNKHNQVAYQEAWLDALIEDVKQYNK